MRTLTRKGYGRIYCEKAEDIATVSRIIEELDPFEHGYLPSDLIAEFDEYPAVVYTHKFCDMDVDMLTAACWKRGVKIWVFDSGNNPDPKPVAAS